MDPLRIDLVPDLRDPIAVMAFGGWNDAASAATNAARFVARRLGARRFASVDPEDFYDFRETRPHVRIDSRGQRNLVWPTNELFYARNPVGPHDIVIGVGVEPNLHWRSFSDAFATLFRDLGVELVVNLGALMADVPHTRDVPVSGSTPDPAVAESLNLVASRYQGPTGIVGVLHDTLRRWGTPAASLWANVPNYITTAQNPPATVALLKRLQPIVGLEFDYRELVSAGERFVGEVNTAISGNPDVLEYVRRLEAASDSGDDTPSTNTSPLPPGSDIVLDVEEFLRGRRDDS